MAIQTKCPHCDKVFTVKAADAIGKKCRCPKCSEPFVVKKYKAPQPKEEEAPADEYDYSYDDDEEYDNGADDYEEVEEAPRRKSSGGSRSKGKKSSKKGGGAPKWILPLLVGVVGVLGLGGLGYGGFVLISKFAGGNIVDMKYFPEETEMIFHVKPGQIWNAPLLADLKNNPVIAAQMKQQQQGLDLEPTDIESVTVGVTNISERRMFNRFSGVAMGPAMSQGPQQSLIVMRLKKDISDADLTKQPNFSSKFHKEQKIVERWEAGRQICQWLASPRLVVLGDEAAVKAAIDRGPKEFRFKHFDIGNTKHQIVMVVGTRGEAKPGTATGRSGIDAAMDKHSKGMYFGVSLNSDVTFDAKISCFDSTGATSIKTELDKGLAAAKNGLASLNPLIANQVQAILPVAKETLDSVKIDASGSNVKIDGRISNKISDAFKQLASNPLFSGAFGGAANQQPMQVPQQPMPTSPGATN